MIPSLRRPSSPTLAVLLATTLVLAGCRGEAPPPPPAPAPTAPAPAATAADFTIPTVEYTWDPRVGDASVPAEMGGPGFTGEGWTTRTSVLAMGDARAIKGGSLSMYTSDWPATLRMTGKDWNSSVNYMISDLCYETLLVINTTTLEHQPNLATHWQISDDKMNYRYRINPAARFSDGSEVTAQDVVASFRLRMEPTLLDPSNILTFGKFDEPKAISKYIVEVTCREPNWRNFIYFSGMTVFPAKEVSIKGSEYLDKYQNAYVASSGPYAVRLEDVKQGESITLTRRPDWWQASNPAWTGVFNIDRYVIQVVKEPTLAFEKAKKGELDYFVIPKAQWWAEELDKIDVVQRGLLLKRKFFTDAPVGTNGLALNMKRPPLDDVRVRKALAHLYDRDTMIEKLYFNEYEPLVSYYQGGVYQNPDNVRVEYDELAAVELLEQAGWTAKNAAGYRVKDGKELRFTLTYGSALSERSLTILQEACKRAGVAIDLQLVTPASGWKNLREKQYDIHDQPWGALVFPNPETSFHSSLADQVDNNNVTAFKDPRVDELCTLYDKSYDVQERIRLIQEIDGLVYQQHPYALGWFNPAQRVVVWNKFSWPAWGSQRTADYDALHYVWWVDPAKEEALAAAKADPAATLPKGEVELHFWAAWGEAQRAARGATGG